MDHRSLKILFDTYWSSSGWNRSVLLPNAEDHAYAKSQRVMFDPVKLTHNNAVSGLRALIPRLSQRQVADGFLASLSTRRLEWRSALGSYAVARWLPEHEETPGERKCRVCGLYAGEQAHDLSIFNFERHKWGGVRHSDPVYASLDLTLFLEEPPPAPTAEDIAICRDLLAAFHAVPSSTTSAELHKHFPKALKANKAERDQVIAILGLCGILGTVDHPGFAERFVPRHQRTLPNRHFVDMAYPACWWIGSDGVNEKRLQEVFGHAL